MVKQGKVGYRQSKEIKQEDFYSRKAAIPLSPGAKKDESQFSVLTVFDVILI
jgi:hypothetical protein